MTNDQIRGKYEELTIGLIDVNRQKDIAEQVLPMETLADLRFACETANAAGSRTV